MAGLTREGFTPLTYEEIVANISGRLRAFSSGIDLSVESPDGQNVEIFSFLLSIVWLELNKVYDSYNPNLATGAALKNLGLITGLAYGTATRSQATVDLTGVAGTIVPPNSVVSDLNGNEFVTQLTTILPSSVLVVSRVSGPINVDAGSINTIVTQIEGWDGINQPSNGRIGAPAQSEITYRNLRNKTVLRNFTDVTEAIKVKLIEQLGISQVQIQNNDSPSTPLSDGTPPRTIHVSVGGIGDASDEDIARVILNSKSLGCPTFGSTTVVVNDSQNNPKSVSFTKATPVTIFINLEVLFLDPDYSGAVDNIRKDLVDHINSLVTGEDVVWSRLFGVITPYSKAQVNSLTLSTDGMTYNASNIVISAQHFPVCEEGYINIVVANT